MNYTVGETAIITCEHKVAGQLKDPTSIKIMITDGVNSIEVDWADMTKTEVGKYRYDYHTPDDKAAGSFAAIVKSVDTGRTTIEQTSFTVSKGGG